LTIGLPRVDIEPIYPPRDDGRTAAAVFTDCLSGERFLPV